ncbi:unannotated protein [freshwater metagenome]|uniref:Unannotated protein n=1 Tax=freshwater metagenome TaxID=449393 RepID=A0A6J7QGJ5_9ZZZZ
MLITLHFVNSSSRFFVMVTPGMASVTAGSNPITSLTNGCIFLINV